MLLFNGDKIKYKSIEGVRDGVVGSVAGSRVYLQSGYVIYLKDVIEKVVDNRK